MARGRRRASGDRPFTPRPPLSHSGRCHHHQKPTLELADSSFAAVPPDARVPAGERRELTNARRTRIASEVLLYAQRIAESGAEQAAYTATNGLVPKQENLAKKRVEEQRKYITELNRRLDALSAKETRAKVTQARVILNKARSELRPIAEETLQTTLEYQTQKQTVK